MKNTIHRNKSLYITSQCTLHHLGHLDPSPWTVHSAKGSKNQYIFHLTLSQIKPSIMNIKIKYMGKDEKSQNIK